MYINCEIYLELDTVITFLVSSECTFLTIENGLMALIYQFIFLIIISEYLFVF